MNENRQDNFGDFFRSKLNEDSPAENQWNVPPDFVFENAMGTIQREKDKKKRRFLWLILPALLLLGLIGFSVYTIQSVNDLHEKVNTIEANQNQATNSQKQTESNILTNSSTDNNSIISDTYQTSSNDKSNFLKSEDKIAQTPPVNNKSFSKKTQAPFITTENKNAGSSKIESFDILPTQTNEENTEESTSALQKNQIETPDFLPVRFGLLGISEKELEGTSLSNPVEKTASKGGPFFITFYANKNLATIGMKRVPQTMSQNLTRYDQNYGGYGFGTQLSYQASKRWSFGIQAGYNCFHNESMLQETMMYDTDKEQTDPQGLNTYSANFNIGTPMGDYEYDANFRLGSNNIPDETPLIHKTSISQTLHSFNLGALVRYSLIKKSNWDWFLGTGLLVDKIFARENNMNTELYHNSSMMFKQEMNTTKMDNGADVFYSLMGETGVRYHLNQKTALILQAQYNTSLTSLREAQFSGDMGSYLHDFNVGVGVQLGL
ncbi:MAG: hypothetical protein R2784_03785 [Saprospiraceae bacterium]